MTDVVIERFRSLDPSRPTQQPPVIESYRWAALLGPRHPGSLADWADNRLTTLRAMDDGTADRLHSYQRYEGGLGRDPVSATKAEPA